jgi:hypothetical protein
MDRADLGKWLAAYEAAWRTPGTEPLQELFSEMATYQAAPFEPPLRGRPAIAQFWEAERAGPEEVFKLRTEIVAVEGDTGVVRVEVIYGEPATRRYRDLWIVTVDEAGSCTAFEEWPFFPGQLRTALGDTGSNDAADSPTPQRL